MIASLKGTLQQKGLGRVVVETGGVGYLVHVSMQTLAELPAEGTQIALRCHTHVREDALQIFGFLSEAEQNLFELLIGVSGIGPKLAQTILSGLPVAELTLAIGSGEVATLQSIPGIGKKTAERMIVELKERCAKLVPQVGDGGANIQGKIIFRGGMAEAVEALVSLGYKRPPAEKAVSRVLEKTDGTLPLEQLVRDALAMMRDF